MRAQDRISLKTAEIRIRSVLHNVLEFGSDEGKNEAKKYAIGHSWRDSTEL